LEVGFRNLSRESHISAQQPLKEQLEASKQRLAALQKEREELLDRIFFHPRQDQQPESWRHRWWRLLVLRPLSMISGRERRLLARLSTLHTIYGAQLQHHQQLLEELIDLQAKMTFHENP
jgi:hypothetical protein